VQDVDASIDGMDSQTVFARIEDAEPSLGGRQCGKSRSMTAL